MIFSSFAKLERTGIKRPSLAPKGYLYWSKLYPNRLENQKSKGFFTTIRVNKGYTYTPGTIIPIYLDHKKPNHLLFKAKILSVEQIRKVDIDEKLARYDADMTVTELWTFLDFFYKRSYGDDPPLIKIRMRKV